jgi:hypothetical protein
VEGDTMKTPEEQAAATNTPDETTNGISQPPAKPSKAAPLFSKNEFEAKNKRRLALIDKEFGSGLTKEEEQEMAQLETETNQYMDAVYPLPFHMLNELRETARREGLLDKKTEG